MVVRGAFKQLRNRFLSKEKAFGDRNAVVVAVAAQKGGVGKTTTAVHLASALAMNHGTKVLLLDMDGQGHVGLSMSQMLSDNGVQSDFGQVLLTKGQDLYDLVTPTNIDNLSVVPSDQTLHETESLISTKIGRELLLKQSIVIARTYFDVILLDCPPNLGNLTLNALVASDFVIAPCDMSALSLDGVDGLIQAIETVQETLNPEVRLLGLVRTRYDKRHKKMNHAIVGAMEENYSPWLFKTVISNSTSVAKAQLEGLPVFMTEPKSPAAVAYQDLASEVLQKITHA